ncbi:MAG TPA: hypothetical protein VGE32_04905, partial [Cellvibrio sp.]
MNTAIVILLTAILITLLGAWGNVRWVALVICVLAVLIWCGILVFKGIGFLKGEAEDSPIINYLRKRKAIAKL